MSDTAGRFGPVDFTQPLPRAPYLDGFACVSVGLGIGFWVAFIATLINRWA